MTTRKVKDTPTLADDFNAPIVKFNKDYDELVKATPRNSIYRHFKGSLYKILGISRHTDHLAMFVTYSPIENPDRIYVRSPIAFFGKTTYRGKEVDRFTKLPYFMLGQYRVFSRDTNDLCKTPTNKTLNDFLENANTYFPEYKIVDCYTEKLYSHLDERHLVVDAHDPTLKYKCLFIICKEKIPTTELERLHPLNIVGLSGVYSYYISDGLYYYRLYTNDVSCNNLLGADEQ